MDEISDLFSEGGYLLEEHIASDAWGELHAARYSRHDRVVLLRRFPPGLAGDSRASEVAIAEVKAWAGLDHPGILGVLDWGMISDEMYVATEMPEGLMLGGYVSGEAPAFDTDAFFSRLLGTIEAARMAGVLHLGLGMTNVWVTRDGGVNVGEFGLWYLTAYFPDIGNRDDPLLAPEQRSGDRISAATDVYTLALIFVALHCGLDTTEAVAGGAAIPAELAERSEIVARCLDPRPLVRYASAGEMAEALGLPIAVSRRDDLAECSICQMKGDLRLGPGVESPTVRYGDGKSISAVTVLWLVALALALATVIVWFLALS